MTSAPVRVLVLCSGNICRSPMAAVVLRQKLSDAGLGDQVQVSSAGIGDWHVGAPADRRAVAALTAGGYDGADHRAAWFDPAAVGEYDLLVAADRTHLADVSRAAQRAGVDADVRLMRSFDPAAVEAGTLEVDDPYYGDADDFTRCLAEIDRATDGMVAHLRGTLAPS